MIIAIVRWLEQNYEVFRAHRTGDHLNIYINGLQKLHKALGDRIWKRRKIPRLL